MTTATAVTIERELLERFLVEVDAIAAFESIRNGGQETWIVEHMYRVLGEFKAATIGVLDDDASDELLDRGADRGRELWDEFVAWMGDDAR